MDNAITPLTPQPLVATPGPFARLAAMPSRGRMMLALGAAGLIAVLVALSLWGQQANYKVLYANLSEKDGGAVIAQLSQMNVPYKHAEGGSAILVPADKVHDLRLKLATAGLPRGSVTGFELMDSARFGQTQFQERLTFQRGLEGELTRSILALGAVEAARVHLALPNQNGFFREQQKPSASVLLTLRGNNTLDRSQLAGIVHLVSSSVPDLNPKAVSVLDQTGALLSGPVEGMTHQGLDAEQLQYVALIEQGYQKRVMEILEPVVGRDNLRATVTAEIDFSQTESTSEMFKPNQGREPAAVRSLQSSDSGASGNGPLASGVPGAASNQPPVPANAPISGPAQALQAAQNGAGGNANGNGRRDNVTNYEVDKTVRVVRNATGSVKRLNAAVVVNHRVSTAPNGKTTSTPLSNEEVENLTALVQESIGFSKERGDSVKVINAPFKVDAVPKPEEVPLWQQPATQDTLRSTVVPVALTLVALMIIFGLVRPALKSAKPPATPVGAQLDTVVADELALPAPTASTPPALEAPKTQDKLNDARNLARGNPAAVANIVSGWVNGESA
jgi:flagellar M-ring protein FliF